MKTAMEYREAFWKQANFYKDINGQAHFPNVKFDSAEIDAVKLGKPNGYYPKMGEYKKARVK